MIDRTYKSHKWSDEVWHIGFWLFICQSGRSWGSHEEKEREEGEIMPKFNADDKARHGIFIHKHELQQDKYSIQKIS